MDRQTYVLEHLRRISIKEMRKWGYLDPARSLSGVISWYQGGEQTSSIGVSSNIGATPPGFWFQYTTNGETVFDWIYLEQLPSNLRKGSLWYFVCPATGRRCRILYFYKSHFVSRLAIPKSIYRSQAYSGKWKTLLAIVNYDRSEVPRTFSYKGKLTRRFLRFLEKQKKMEKLLEAEEGGI